MSSSSVLRSLLNVLEKSSSSSDDMSVLKSLLMLELSWLESLLVSDIFLEDLLDFFFLWCFLLCLLELLSDVLS